MARVGLVFGGRSVEHLVSITSARTVASALKEAGHTVVALGVAENGAWVSPAASQEYLDGKKGPVVSDVSNTDAAKSGIASTLHHIVDAQVDVVFPIAHGTYGEDGCLQGFLESIDMPYAGGGVASSGVAMDKLLSKRIFSSVGLPQVPYWAIHVHDFEENAEAVLAPFAALYEAGGVAAHRGLFVKPSSGGSSVGCSPAPTFAALHDAVALAAQFDSVVLVEKSVKAREIECAILGGRRPQPSIIGEIRPGNDFYDYEDKYLDDNATLLAPAHITPEQTETVQKLAVEAFRALGCYGMARVDFFLDVDTQELYLNEINTLPGFTSISMYPRLWGLSGVPLPQLVDKLVQLGIERHQERKAKDAGIHAWVAAINAKASAKNAG